jgi:hypothetical protein
MPALASLRLFRLKGQPITIIGEGHVTYGEDVHAEWIVSNHCRIVEIMKQTGSEFEWRGDALFPSNKPIRLPENSIGYDREVNRTNPDAEDRLLIEQYDAMILKQRAAASGIQMLK